MEWIEVEAPTVDAAVGAAVKELGLGSADQVDVEIIREPKRGILGIGAQNALVKVTPKPQTGRKRRRRRRGRSSDKAATGAAAAEKRPAGAAAATQTKKPSGQKPKPTKQGAEAQKQQRRRRVDNGKTADEARSNKGDTPEASIDEQAKVAEEFLEGLLDAFGLEGDVTTRTEEDILFMDVTGAQTEALVGAKGSIMQSILELTRTVVQRKTYGAPRMRLDIAGYAEQRREALKIYAGKLADRVLAEGGEVMLEPMNPADRKVVHDAIAEIEGVRSFSEGEDPHRSVIVAPAE